MIWIGLLAGLALLVAGGEVLVRGASDLARRFGVSPLLIGLTVVGFGTSTPELVTSLQAAFAGSPGIAVGNVVGSNTANILLILGVAAVLMPFAVERQAFARDGPVLALSALACLAVVLSGALSRPAGALLVAGLVAYLVWAYRSERLSGTVQDGAQDTAQRATPMWRAALLAAVGIALTVLGARLLVDAAVDLAARWGIPDAVVGLTIVAVGTSLPELVTTVVAAVRREGAIAFGNVIGSNIYNVLGILGVTALVKPIEVPAQIAAFDIWVMLAATAALAVAAISGWRLTRAEGAALLAAYAAYVGWLAASL